MTEPKWKLKVEQLMACNCNWGCPCSFDAPPTYGKCETALAYRIGDRVRVEFEPMRNPVTGEDHFLIGQLPTGLFTKSEEFFSAKNFRVAVNGFQFDYPGRNAILAASTWRGPTPAKPHA